MVGGSIGLLPAQIGLLNQSDPCRIRAEISMPQRLPPSSERACPAVYKTAALPTELHRREDLCMVADTGPDMLFPALNWAYTAAADTDRC